MSRLIHSMSGDARREHVEARLVELGPIVSVTYAMIRNGEPTTLRVNALGVARSTVGAADALVVRGGANGQLWTIPLTVIRTIEEAS